MVKVLKKPKLKILITGGNGYLGGRLGKYFINIGHEVVLGSRNVKHDKKIDGEFSLVNTLWEDPESLERACHNIDVIIHAAGMNSGDCEAAPNAAFEVNGSNTKRLITAANNVGVTRFLYLSTVHVYNNPLQGTLNEESPTSNNHPYAASKLQGENFVFWANNNLEIDGYILRLSNAVGAPIQRNLGCWQLLVNDLCKQVVITRKMMIKSNGTQQRDFISIDQICEVIQDVTCKKMGDLKYKLFNLSSGVSYNILEMAKIIQECCFEVLDFHPEIQKISSDLKNHHTNLLIENKRIFLGKMHIEDHLRKEIKKLLLFCKTEFLN